MTSKHDPLEAAKISPRKARAQASATAATEPAPPVAQEPVPDMPPAVTPKAMPEAVSERPAGRFRVTKAGKYSWHGQINYAVKGQIIDASAYGGLPGIDRLIQAGVELEPLEE